MTEEVTALATYCQPNSKEFAEFLEPLSYLGISAIEKLYDDRLIDFSVETIVHILKKQNKNYYDYPTALMRLHFIGILLLRVHNYERYRKFRKQLQEVDLNGDERFKQLMQFRDNFIYKTFPSNSLVESELSKEMIRSLKAEEIDEYIFYTYSVCDNYCSMKKEHEDRINKQPYVMHMIRILKENRLEKQCT